MVELGALAYPVVLLLIVLVSRLGRAQRWGAYEWMRVGAVALLLGLAVAVQVKLAMLGLAQQPLPFVGAIVSLAGTGILVAMYLHERLLREARPLPKLSAVVALE